MNRSPGLFRLTGRRFATPRSAALVVIALTMLAAFALAAAPRALVGVVRAEVSHQLSGVAATSRDLTGLALDVPAFGPASTDQTVTEGWDAGAPEVFGTVAGSLEQARQSFDPALRDLTSPAQFAEFSAAGVVAVPGAAEPEQAETDPFAVIQILSEPAAQQALTLVDGTWPQDWDGHSGTIGIALSVQAAETMGWPVGQERRIPASAQRLSEGWMPGTPTYVLAGTVTAVDPAADRWLHLPTALTATVFDDGNSRPKATSVAWVPAGTWAKYTAAQPRSVISLWYPVDAAAARAVEPTELLSAVRGATTASLPLDASGQLRVRLETELVSTLTKALARATSASAILAVAAVGPLAVSVALIVLACALMVRRRRTDLSLLSARGASFGRLRRLVFSEGLLLGLPAALIGATAGVLVAPNEAGTFPTVLASFVGLAPGVALAAVVRPATIERGRSDLDAPVRGRWTRVIEIVVVILAVAAVVQLVLRGIDTGTTTIDPLVIVAPLLAIVALALLVVRVHPLPIAAALAAARRGRGVVGLVGAARNLRDPAAGTTAVLAMVVAVAIAVFSSVVLATVDRGAAVAAQRSVGADLRIAGPYVDESTLERMRAADGVTDVVGILTGDYLTVAGPGGRVSAQTLVTDPARLAAVQRGFVGAFPSGVIAAGAAPVQVVLSQAVVDEVGEASTVQTAPVEVGAVVGEVSGMPGTNEFVVLAASDYTALTTLGFYPRTVLVDIDDGADPHAVAAALGEVIGQNHTVLFLDDLTAEIQASPAVTALRFVLFAALGLAALLSVVALLLVAGVSREARSRLIALLRTMGLDKRRARGIIAWEFVPLGLTALVGGLLLGAILPSLVVISIDLRPFTGGGAQPSLTMNPLLSGALIAVVVVALALAVLAGVVGARTISIATVLRTEED